MTIEYMIRSMSINTDDLVGAWGKLTLELPALVKFAHSAGKPIWFTAHADLLAAGKTTNANKKIQIGFSQSEHAPLVGNTQNCNILAIEELIGSRNTTYAGQSAEFSPRLLSNLSDAPLTFFVRRLEILDQDTDLQFRVYLQFYIQD